MANSVATGKSIVSRDLIFNTRAIKREMAIRGWTAADMAQELGVNKNSIYRFLNGDTKSLPMLKAIANVLEMSIHDLIE